MPTFELLIEDEKVSISTGELAKALQQPAAKIALVSQALKLMQGLPLSALTTDFLEVEFTLGQDFQWQLPFAAGGMLIVTAAAETKAKVILRKGGEILKFASEAQPDDDDVPMEQPVPAQVSPGMAYASLLLRVSLEASGEAAVQSGPFGVKGNLGTKQTFLLAYHHAVTADTLTGAALKQMAESFVLPYRQDQLLGLSPQCYSEFEYIGEIQFGVEATVGYSGTLLFATSKQQLLLSKETELGAVAVQVKPELNLGATVSIGYSHLDAFRTVAKGIDSKRIGLFYFKMDQSTFSAGFKVEAKAVLNPGVEIELAGKLTNKLNEQLEKLVPLGTPKRVELLKKLRADALAAAAEKAAAKRIGDLVKSLEKRYAVGVFGGFERISQRTVLMGYEFERKTGAPAFAQARQANLRDLAHAAGVTVAAGSFVRDSVTRRCSIGLALFGNGAVTVDEFFRSCDLSFEGDGTFRLQYAAGKKTKSNLFGHLKAVETLFTATTRAIGEGVIRDSDIRLRITLYQQNSPDAARRSASVLAMILTDGGELARLMKSAIGKNPKGAYKVTCSIAPSAFGRLKCTEFEVPFKQPKMLPHINDQANYRAFMAAYRILYSDQVGFLPQAADAYTEWARVDEALNGGSLNTVPVRPNRRTWPGGPVLGDLWPESGDLAGVNHDDRFAVAIVLNAARNFMNTCDDLATLATSLDTQKTEAAFKAYAEGMATVAKKLPGTFPLQFTQPTLAALCAQMGAKVAVIEAPADDQPRDEFALNLKLA